MGQDEQDDDSHRIPVQNSSTDPSPGGIPTVSGHDERLVSEVAKRLDFKIQRSAK